MSHRPLLKIAIFIASMAFATSSALAQAKEKVTFLLNWYVYSEHAPFFLGKERGYFEQEGIDLDIQEGRGTSVTVQAVSAGSAQFGYADIATMIKAAAKGAPVISVGVLLQTSPMAVVSLEEKGIATLQDLKGKTVVMTPGDSMFQVWPLLLQKNNLKASDIRVLSADSQAKVMTVANGQADATLGYVMDQAVKLADTTKKPVRSVRFADYGVNLISSGIVVKKDTLKTNPELIRRFMRAATRSMEAAIQEPEAAVDAMLKISPKSGVKETMLVGLKQTTALYRAPNEAVAKPYRVAHKTMAESFQMLVEYGGMDKSNAGAVDSYFTNDFLP